MKFGKAFSQWILRPWCRHPHITLAPRTSTMPPHMLCPACGWREAVTPARPTGTRTWDSTRDEERYQREKQRRAAAERARTSLLAQSTRPFGRARGDRAGEVVRMRRASGE